MRTLSEGASLCDKLKQVTLQGRVKIIIFVIEVMTDKTILLKDLKHHLQENLGDYILDIILFGSQSTGLSSQDSDFDILILAKSKPDWNLKRKISDYCYDIDLKYNIITDTHILTKQELSKLRGKQPIFQKAIQEGIYA